MSECRYRIVVDEPLHAAALAALSPLDISRGDGVAVIAGDVPSGADVAPLVRRVLELGLTLVSVETERRAA